MPRVQDALPSLDCRAWKGRSNPLLLSALRFAPQSRTHEFPVDQVDKAMAQAFDIDTCMKVVLTPSDN
jgi:hypothetical protein